MCAFVTAMYTMIIISIIMAWCDGPEIYFFFAVISSSHIIISHCLARFSSLAKLLNWSIWQLPFSLKIFVVITSNVPFLTQIHCNPLIRSFCLKTKARNRAHGDLSSKILMHYLYLQTFLYSNTPGVVVIWPKFLRYTSSSLSYSEYLN